MSTTCRDLQSNNVWIRVCDIPHPPVRIVSFWLFHYLQVPNLQIHTNIQHVSILWPLAITTLKSNEIRITFSHISVPMWRHKGITKKHPTTTLLYVRKPQLFGTPELLERDIDNNNWQPLRIKEGEIRSIDGSCHYLLLCLYIECTNTI